MSDTSRSRETELLFSTFDGEQTWEGEIWTEIERE